jgi:transcriptional regulator GlxA family with amidase domain
MDRQSTVEEVRSVLATLPRRLLGAFVFPGFRGLDLWGPLEVFGACSPAIHPVLLGMEAGVVPSIQGPAVVAEFGLDAALRPDLLLVPGGEVRPYTADGNVLAWIRARSEDAELVMSLRNGADLLAHAGVLDGRRATTNEALFRSIATAHPRVEWVAGARWVQDGRFVTSSGVAAGVDMALAIVARLAGREIADALAARLEHEGVRDSTDDPYSSTR